MIFLLLFFSLLPASAQTRLLRQPAYHRGTVAFSYLGDIWTVHEDGTNPKRLTVNRAREYSPRFSPDGHWLAFTSTREGNGDVFVIPAAGGEPKQLTFHSGEDRVEGWTPDSRKVIFSSPRAQPFGTALFQVPVEGGPDEALPIGPATYGGYSPDGRKFVFNPPSNTPYRKHYRGGFAAKIWLWDIMARHFTLLTGDEYQGNSLWPMYASDGFIYFVANRLPDEKRIQPGGAEVMRSVNNIWKMPATGGKPVQVTHQTSGNLFFPSISADGRTIVYEEDFGLWKLDLAGGKSSEIRVAIASDAKESPRELVTIDGKAQNYDLAPTGKRAVIETRGEIFTVPIGPGDVQPVTNSAAYDIEPRWSPDGQWIAYVSDESGRPEIWLGDAHGKSRRKLTNSDMEKTSLAWAPDSKSLLFLSDLTLYQATIHDGKSRSLITGETELSAPQWSPDGTWIAYTKGDRNRLSRVFIRNLGDGTGHPVTLPSLVRTSNPVWTPDGKKLLFLGSNSAASDVAKANLYSLTLDLEPEPGSEDNAQASGHIVWTNLERRIRQLTRMTENVGSVAVSPDSRTYAFTAAGQIYTLGAQATKPVRLTTANSEDARSAPAMLEFSPDGRLLYFAEAGAIYSLPASSPGAPKQRLNFNIRMLADHAAERHEAFHQAWYTLKYRMYDPTMRGLDWTALGKKYESLLDYCDDDETFRDLLALMIGNLNMSHANVGAPEGETPALRSRHPGFELSPDPSGFYKVAKIFKGGPADRDYVKLQPGDYVLSLDGHRLDTRTSYWKMYNQSLGKYMDFTANSRPSDEGAWRVRIEPVDAGENLYYKDWVENNRRMVDELSGNRIAYMHILSMDPENLHQFEQELYNSRDKAAAIVDVRYNGGGSIDQQLIQLMGARRFSKMQSRTGLWFDRPQRGFWGPMAMLQNERSGSDSEITIVGFRTLGLGKTVGTPTLGAVLSTAHISLLNGTGLGIPQGRHFALDGVEMENHSQRPDIFAVVTPDDYVHGRDPQVKSALDSLLRQLKSGVH